MKRPAFEEEVPLIAALDAKGREVPDPKPMSIPSGFRRPETLAEQVARLVRSETFTRARAAEGNENFDEADDFEVDDDFDLATPWEMVFDPSIGREVSPAEQSGHDRRREGPEHTAHVAAQKRRYEKLQKAAIERYDQFQAFVRKMAPKEARKPVEEPSKGGRPGGSPPAAKPTEEA